MTYEIIFVGLVVALLFYELTGFYPGGLIVPAYLALYLHQPLRVLGTVLVAVVTWATYHLLSKIFILYGRRRFALILLLGGVWGFLWKQIFPLYWPFSVDIASIGWLIPGLLANTIERQGFWTTLFALGVVLFVTHFIKLLFWGY